MKNIFIMFVGLTTLLSLTGCGPSAIELGEQLSESDQNSSSDTVDQDTDNNDSDQQDQDTENQVCLESVLLNKIQSTNQKASCKKASSREVAQVNKGNTMRDEFLVGCYAANKNSCWCNQLTRPNPSSINFFRCTYGKDQVHQLIHPDKKTWKNAYTAVAIVRELFEKNIEAKIIYNWWRPAAYNKNVGGAAKRHPFGTSVDVRFKTKSGQNRAFQELCKMRKKGRIRAIGYYASTALHFGVGDNAANTWGKSCP